MKGRISHLACAAIAVLVATVLAGPALAGGKPDSTGNAANAPGQQTQDQPAAAEQQARQQATPRGKANAPGQQAKALTSNSSTNARARAAATHPAPHRWSNAQGKDKKNVPAVATSIPGSSTGPGPGRSGWHKYTICHNGHAITVDVHSATAHVTGHGDSFLPFNTKGKAACSEGQATPTGSESTQRGSAEVVASGGAGAPTTLGSSLAGTLESESPALATGGVAGVTASLGRPSPTAVGGVLGALASVGRAGTLPFTGFPLWAAVLAALALVGLGLVARRRTRTTRDVV
jgi:hypothetical protein